MQLNDSHFIFFPYLILSSTLFVKKRWTQYLSKNEPKLTFSGVFSQIIHVNKSSCLVMFLLELFAGFTYFSTFCLIK